jgi:hypothetical protein
MTQEHLDMENALKEMNRDTTEDDTTRENLVVRFDRGIFLYNIDEVPRQREAAQDDIPADFNSIINHSILMNKKTDAHSIIIDILTNSQFMFKKFRERMFKGRGSFTKDFQAIAKNIETVSTNREHIGDIRSKLDSFEEGTLIQINYRTGQVVPVTVPKSNITINQWATKYNRTAGPNIHYAPAGLKLR